MADTMLHHYADPVTYNCCTVISQDLALNFPAFNGKLSKFKENLKPFQSLRWDHFWKIHVLPAL